MSAFWPSGIELTDLSSPLDILRSAQKEWAERGEGILTLVIQEAEASDSNRMLIVHAKHPPTNRLVALFSVVHRPDAPYPATIQPRGNKLPNYLKKTYYQPGIAEFGGFAGLASGLAVATKGHQVTNKWVCETPAEFRSKLSRVFNLGAIKSEILSLAADATPVTPDGERAMRDGGSSTWNGDGDEDEVL